MLGISQLFKFIPVNNATNTSRVSLRRYTCNRPLMQPLVITRFYSRRPHEASKWTKAPVETKKGKTKTTSDTVKPGGVVITKRDRPSLKSTATFAEPDEPSENARSEPSEDPRSELVQKRRGRPRKQDDAEESSPQEPSLKSTATLAEPDEPSENPRSEPVQKRRGRPRKQQDDAEESSPQEPSIPSSARTQQQTTSPNVQYPTPTVQPSRPLSQTSNASAYYPPSSTQRYSSNFAPLPQAYYPPTPSQREAYTSTRDPQEQNKQEANEDEEIEEEESGDEGDESAEDATEMESELEEVNGEDTNLVARLQALKERQQRFRDLKTREVQLKREAAEREKAEQRRMKYEQLSKEKEEKEKLKGGRSWFGGGPPKDDPLMRKIIEEEMRESGQAESETTDTERAKKPEIENLEKERLEKERENERRTKAESERQESDEERMEDDSQLDLPPEVLAFLQNKPKPRK